MAVGCAVSSNQILEWDVPSTTPLEGVVRTMTIERNVILPAFGSPLRISMIPMSAAPCLTVVHISDGLTIDLTRATSIRTFSRSTSPLRTSSGE